MAVPTSTADALCDQAKTCLKKKDYAQTVALYDKAIAADPRSIVAHEGRAIVAFITKDYPKAIEHFKKVSTLDFRRAQPLINLGAVYNRQADYQNAAKTLRQAIGKDRKSAEAYYNLGISYRGLNQQSMAVSAYKEAIKLDPRMLEGHQNLANLYVEMGNNSQAQFHYHKCLEIDPKFEKAIRGLQKASDAAVEAKKMASPFGRLVTKEDLARSHDFTAFRQLSAQERFEDRQVLHTMTRELEPAVLMLSNVIRDRVEQAILRTTHAFTQTEDPHLLLREFENFKDSCSLFRQQLQNLSALIKPLRDHEAMVRAPEGK